VSVNSYRFAERWTIPGFSPQQVYDVLADVKLLPEWWTGVYLEAIPEDPAAAPRIGARARVKARGFLPYRIRMTLEATVLDPGKAVGVRTWGDLEGTWRATLSPDGAGGTRVDIVEEVVGHKAVIRLLSPLLKPVFAWNHYWTSPRGQSGLRAFLAKRHGA